MKRASYSCCNFLCVVLAAAYLKYRRCRLSCLPFVWHFFSLWHTHTHRSQELWLENVIEFFAKKIQSFRGRRNFFTQFFFGSGQGASYCKSTTANFFRLQLCAVQTFLALSCCSFHAERERPKLEKLSREDGQVGLLVAISSFWKLRLKFDREAERVRTRAVDLLTTSTVLRTNCLSAANRVDLQTVSYLNCHQMLKVSKKLSTSSWYARRSTSSNQGTDFIMKSGEIKHNWPD